MMMLYNQLPTLDLHGMDREYARILINDFIHDHYLIGDQSVIIVHGNGTGIIKKTTQEVLKRNKIVEDFKIDNFNSGMTIVRIRKKA